MVQDGATEAPPSSGYRPSSSGYRPSSSGYRTGSSGYRPSAGFLGALCAVYALGAAVILPLDWRAQPADDGRPVPMAIYARAAAQPATPVPSPAPDSIVLEQAAFRRFAHEPLARILRRRTSEPEMADRIARALVAEANRIRVAPSLLAAVLLTENYHLDPDTVSHRGATGLMQVMPFHAGEYGCPSDDLTDVEANICHGARIFGRYLRRSGTVASALLRYNGCPADAVAAQCTRYPGHVLALAGRLRRDMLRYAARATPPASAVRARTAAAVVSTSESLTVAQ